MASISDVLLRVTGDVSGAETDLARLAAELEAFNKQEADAEISIDDTAFRAEIAKARAELAALDRQDVDIDVDSDSIATAGRRADTARGSIGGFSGSLGQMFGLVARGAPIISGLGAVLLALVSSLLSAALGAGALGIALASTLGPAILLVIGAVRRFKDESDKAGTAANRLKREASDLGSIFDRTLGPAIDKVFGGLADVLPAIGRALSGLKPDFTALGGAVASAIERFAGFVTSRASVEAMRRAIDTLATLVRGPGTSAFINFAKILRDIATAAAPLLVGVMRDVAGSLRDIAGRTSDIKGLRETIRDQVSDLRDWADLLGQVGRIFTGLFKAALPDGRELVSVLRDGARSLADWINSTEGQNRIREFLDQVIPVAREVLRLVGKLIEAFLSWSELTAPAMRLIFRVLNTVADVLNKVLDLLNKLPGPLDAIAGGLLLLGGGKILGSIGGLRGALGLLRGNIIALAGRFGPLALAVAGGIEAFKAGIPVGHDLADSMKGAYVQATNFDKALDVVKRFGSQAAVATGAAAKVFKGLADTVKDVVGDIVGAFRDGEPKTRKTAGDMAHAGLAAIKALTGDFGGAGRELIDRFADGQRDKEGAARNAGSQVGRASKGALSDLSGEFHEVGETSGDRYAGGVGGKEGASRNAGNTIARAARSALAEITGLFNDEGGQAGDRYASGVGGKEGAARGSGHTLAAAVRDGLQSLDFATITGGIVNKILGGFGGIVGALKNLGISAISAFIEGFTSKSVPAPPTPGGGGGGGKSSKVGEALANGLAASLEPVLGSLSVTAAPAAGAGASTVIQNFNVPAAPAAHGQPDPRHTAAQLGILLRRRGGRG